MSVIDDSTTIVKRIREGIERLEERNFKPAFIVLGEKSYSSLCEYTKWLVEISGQDKSLIGALVSQFDNIPVVFCPEVPDLYVGILPAAPDCFLYHQQQ